MSDRSLHSVVLGGIGGDCHSVGLTILRQSLRDSGYEVIFLGNQNRIEDFFAAAPGTTAVLISSMDGHARYYVRGFPELRHRQSSATPLWYLGGNLHIGEAAGHAEYFRSLGFHRVFVKFTDVRTVLDTLAADLADIVRPSSAPLELPVMRPAADRRQPPPPDGLLPITDWSQRRPEVLDQWRTGAAAKDLEANAAFLARHRSFAAVQDEVNRGRRTLLLQPRIGVASAREQLRLFGACRDGGAGVLSYQVDSLTRNNDYSGAEQALCESRARRSSTLNGFPVINHGPSVLRRITAQLQMPLQTRHSTRDPRLLAEISYAGGVSAFEGGAICYNIPYYRDYPLEESLQRWQYVDRLTGLYHERFGLVLDREFFGTLTATLIPPSLAIVVNLIEALLAASQGVRCVSLGYAEQGHRSQDIAAIRMLRVLAHEIFANLGFHRVQVNTVFHQYMAAFPADRSRAEELIANSAITATLAGATRAVLKTPVEALRIPVLEDNLRALTLAMQGIAASHRVPIDEPRVEQECRLIRREVEALIGSVLACGRGSLTAGVATAFRCGYLDVPFSPSLHNRGEVLTARDAEGAVRFASFGNLQFDSETREFHRDRMAVRRRRAGLTSERQNYRLVEQDVMQVPRGEYDGWPLSA